MARNIETALKRVLQDKADEIAVAQTPEAVSDLAPELIEAMEDEYKPISDPFLYRATIVVLGAVTIIVAGHTQAIYLAILRAITRQKISRPSS